MRQPVIVTRHRHETQVNFFAMECPLECIPECFPGSSNGLSLFGLPIMVFPPRSKYADVFKKPVAGNVF
jgi:hypothetical protein